MDPAKKRRATYQDVLDSPEYLVAEIVGGELRQFHRPSGPATATASVLGYEIGPPFMRGRGGPGGWVVLYEPELHLGEDIVVPDLAGWRRERLSVVPDAAFLTVAPDWVCEVLSRSTERFDRDHKMPLYSTSGVRHAWLVDPRRHTLEVFMLHDGRWVQIAIHREADRARIPPFDAIELDLAVLWADAALPARLSEERAQYLPGGY